MIKQKFNKQERICIDMMKALKKENIIVLHKITGSVSDTKVNFYIPTNGIIRQYDIVDTINNVEYRDSDKSEIVSLLKTKYNISQTLRSESLTNCITGKNLEKLYKNNILKVNILDAFDTIFVEFKYKDFRKEKIEKVLK